MSNVAILRPTAQPVTDEEVWETWRMEMVAAGCRPRTLREREFIFNHFARWIGKPVIVASRSDLMSWLSRPELSPKSRQNYKSFLHTLFTTAQDAGLRADNPATRLPRTRIPQTEANPFSTAQVQAILDCGIYGRTRMMVLLAAYQGLRATEIAAVDGRNIDWDGKRIFTVDAKGGREVWRPLHPAVHQHAIDAGFPTDGPWFPSPLGGHVRGSSVSNTLCAAVKRAGFTGHRAHQLRAWHATELVEAGADMLTVQHAMRHATAATLKHYVRPSQKLIEEALVRLPVLSVPTSTRRAAHV